MKYFIFKLMQLFSINASSLQYLSYVPSHSKWRQNSYVATLVHHYHYWYYSLHRMQCYILLIPICRLHFFCWLATTCFRKCISFSLSLLLSEDIWHFDIICSAQYISFLADWIENTLYSIILRPIAFPSVIPCVHYGLGSGFHNIFKNFNVRYPNQKSSLPCRNTTIYITNNVIQLHSCMHVHC